MLCFNEYVGAKAPGAVKGHSALVRYLVLLLAFPLNDALAYEPARANNNLAHELAACSAFYMLSSVVLKSQKPDLAEKFGQIGETAIEYSAALTSEKLALARVEMATKSMMKDIDNDAVNYSILLNEYSDRCGEAVSDPVKRLEYWLNKQD
ncbi:hypothetical protein [Pseudomonas viridiflava]|uniref:hypothetical protein n=1 Tax=Pseudomonas viridiflava TaxID=33069 RepID=UPI001F07C6CD|nr:hypothetical protein [Pseudomonas viridiflava]